MLMSRTHHSLGMSAKNRMGNQHWSLVFWIPDPTNRFKHLKVFKNFRSCLTTEAIQQSGKAESRAETPPPTYDEALSVSHSVRLSDETTSQPLFIALPNPQTESNPHAQVDQNNQNEFPAEDDDQPPSYTAVSCPDVIET